MEHRWLQEMYHIEHQLLGNVFLFFMQLKGPVEPLLIEVVADRCHAPED